MMFSAGVSGGDCEEVVVSVMVRDVGVCQRKGTDTDEEV